MRELARVDDRPLQPLDGRREAPDRKRMIIRSPDGAAQYPIFPRPAPLLLCRLLFPATTFVRFASAPSARFSGGA
jgi:hypothetical protein